MTIIEAMRDTGLTLKRPVRNVLGKPIAERELIVKINGFVVVELVKRAKQPTQFYYGPNEEAAVEAFLR